MTDATATPSPDDALIDAADRQYEAGNWSAALFLYRGVEQRNRTGALDRGAPIAIGHCLLELHDALDPTELARQLVPPVPEAARLARLGAIRIRALVLCRAGDPVRARRLLLFLASFDPGVTGVYLESFIPGRSGCWERSAPGATDEPGFLRDHRWSDAEIAACKARFSETRVLIILPWNYAYGPGERFTRSAAAFGLDVRTLDLHEWLNGVDPAGAAARLQSALDEHRPAVVLHTAIGELGFAEHLRASLYEATARVFEAERARHGTRVVACFFDPWVMPKERLTLGLGRSVDLVHHCHPLMHHDDPSLNVPSIYCFPWPILTAPSTVEAGTVPRACMVGSINFATPARLVWWAEARCSEIPIDVIETAFDGANMLTPERYTDVLREHQLIINLTRRVSGVRIVTGRSLEVPSVGGVLLEENTYDTRHLLQPGVHYVPFETWTDLRELVPALLADHDRRRALAIEGQRWVQKHFTGDWFWAGLLTRLRP